LTEGVYFHRVAFCVVMNHKLVTPGRVLFLSPLTSLTFVSLKQAMNPGMQVRAIGQ